MRKGIIIRIFALIIIFASAVGVFKIFPGNSNSAIIKTDYNNYKTGSILPDKEQSEWMDKNFDKTKYVKLNDIGLERINNELESSGEEQLTGAISKLGEDIITANNLNTSANQLDVNSGLTAEDLPDSVDNSLLEAFPPIRSQTGNSCAAFASTYYQLTYMTALARGWDVKDENDNSNKFSYKWTYNLINRGVDNGSWIGDSYKIMIDNGVPLWNDFEPDGEFKEWSADASIWENAINYKIDNTGVVENIDEEEGLYNLKAMINNGYVLVFSTYVFGWNFIEIKDDSSTNADDNYAGKNVVSFVQNKDTGHSMTVVGYDDNIWADVNDHGVVDEGEKGAFKIANSWGTTYEDNGFTWFSYDALKAVSMLKVPMRRGRRMVVQ